MNEIQVRRKFLSRQSTRSGKDKWWFVLHGNEDSLQSLESTWETVKLQTGWQLEQCTKPIDHAVIDTESGNATPPPQPLPDATSDNSNADGAAIPSSPPPSTATTSEDEEAGLDDVRAPTATDTIIPNSQASTNSTPSSDPNQSSSSHSFLETAQVTHSPPLLI